MGILGKDVHNTKTFYQFKFAIFCYNIKMTVDYCLFNFSAAKTDYREKGQKQLHDLDT